MDWNPGSYRPGTKPRRTRAEAAYSAAALDPRPDALARWQTFYGVDRERGSRPRGAQSNRRRGTAIEGIHGGHGVEAVLRAQGYARLNIGSGSLGPADVIGQALAAGQLPILRAVQAKRLATFAPSGLNDAVRVYLGLREGTRGWPFPHGTREAWLWADDLGGWCADLVITPDARISVRAGQQADRSTEVRRSVTEMIARERERRSAAQSSESLKRKLGVV